MQVFIHGGHLSLDNGATAPLSMLFALAKLTGSDVQQGQTYGEDSIEVSDEDWPTVEEMLKEHKMLYKLNSLSGPWLGVVSESVKQRLGM
jgi:hypothetical protein